MKRIVCTLLMAIAMTTGFAQTTPDYVQKAKLDLVINRYPIFFRQDSNSVFISSPQIDSALMLLPYYRDNLEYDAENKTWSIVTVREKVIISEREVNRKKKR